MSKPTTRVRSIRWQDRPFDRQKNDPRTTSRWRKKKAAFLKLHPICMRCRHRPATSVHHHFRVPTHHQHCFSEFVDGVRNLVAICQECHQQEHRGEPRTRHKPLFPAQAEWLSMLQMEAGN